MITLDVGASCVREQVREPPSERPQQTDPDEERGHECLQHVVRAHRDAARRDCDPVPDPLCGVGKKPFKNRRAEARPHQSLGHVRVRGVELVQIGVRLPLLETEFDLPPKAVEPGDQVGGERRARQIGAQSRHRAVAARDDDHAEADQAVPARVLDVEVQMASGIVGQKARQPDARRPSTHAARTHGS